MKNKSTQKQAKKTVKPGKNGNPPPIDKGFQKGKSGNPEGRKPGTKNRATLFKKWMEIKTKGKNPVSGIEEEMSVEDKMVLKIISKVLIDGDVSAFKEAMDSVYGKHRDYMDLTSDGDKLNNAASTIIFLPANERDKIKS